MKLDTLSILNYKNIKEANLLFSDKINCFIGRNGMGKTNVLDAIYYLSFCKSHSNLIDSQNIEHDAEFCLIQGNYTLRDNQEEVYCGMKRRQKKQFKRNKKTYDRLTDHIGLLPLVLVSPDDSELIADGSDERRKFMDGVISQYDKTYLNHLLSYNNALKQRNALLKNETLPDISLFEILEDQMAFHAEYIHRERDRFIEQFTPIFIEFYNTIAEHARHTQGRAGDDARRLPHQAGRLARAEQNLPDCAETRAVRLPEAHARHTALAPAG